MRAWAQAYMNNIICNTKLLSNLLQKLRILFKIFLKYNISIKPTKSYINYYNIGLLGQQVNFLSLIIFTEKPKAIYFLIYPDTLGALEYYLRLIGYFCNYIHFYT